MTESARDALAYAAGALTPARKVGELLDAYRAEVLAEARAASSAGPATSTDRAAVLLEAADWFEQDRAVQRMFGHQVAAELRRLAGEAQQDAVEEPETDEEAVVVHACPEPGDNGISRCCGRPPCEFVGERLTRDPEKVTCQGG